MMGRPRIKTSPAIISQREDDARALQMRKSGMTYDEISAAMGMADRSGSWHAVNRALMATIKEPAEELRTLECARLDQLLAGMWEDATAGKGWAVDRCLAIMDRRARLLGLDAPMRIRTEVVTEDHIDAEIRRLENYIEDRGTPRQAIEVESTPSSGTGD